MASIKFFQTAQNRGPVNIDERAGKRENFWENKLITSSIQAERLAKNVLDGYKQRNKEFYSSYYRIKKSNYENRRNDSESTLEALEPYPMPSNEFFSNERGKKNTATSTKSRPSKISHQNPSSKRIPRPPSGNPTSKRHILQSMETVEESNLTNDKCEVLRPNLSDSPSYLPSSAQKESETEDNSTLKRLSQNKNPETTPPQIYYDPSVTAISSLSSGNIEREKFNSRVYYGLHQRKSPVRPTSALSANRIGATPKNIINLTERKLCLMRTDAESLLKRIAASPSPLSPRQCSYVPQQSQLEPHDNVALEDTPRPTPDKHTEKERDGDIEQQLQLQRRYQQWPTPREQDFPAQALHATIPDTQNPAPEQRIRQFSLDATVNATNLTGSPAPKLNITGKGDWFWSPLLTEALYEQQGDDTLSEEIGVLLKAVTEVFDGCDIK